MSLENDDLAVSFWKQGKLCAERSQFDQAIKHFDEAVRLAPHSAHIRRSLHDARCSAKPRGTVGKLETLKLLKLKAQLLVESKRKNWESVLDVATAAQAIDPWDGEVCLSLAEAAASLCQDDVAGLFYERAAEFCPDSPKCLEAYARMLEKANQLPQALTIWHKVTDLLPDDHEIRRHAERLKNQVYVETRAARRRSQPSRDVSADATVLDEGDTHDGTTPIPQRELTEQVEEPSVSRSRPAQPVPKLTEKVLALLQDADRLVSECRLREAGAVLKKAHVESLNDRRIGQLLTVVDTRDIRVPARKRVADYQLLRQDM